MDKEAKERMSVKELQSLLCDQKMMRVPRRIEYHCPVQSKFSPEEHTYMIEAFYNQKKYSNMVFQNIIRIPCKVEKHVIQPFFVTKNKKKRRNHKNTVCLFLFSFLFVFFKTGRN